MKMQTVKERLEEKDLKKLSDLELKFMQYIWKYPDGVSSEEIYANFPQTRGTKSTVLYNISEKGYVDKVQRGLHHFYQAKVQEEEYKQAVLKIEMERILGDSSFECLVTAFCGKSKLNKRQKNKIENLLKELEREDDER